MTTQTRSTPGAPPAKVERDIDWAAGFAEEDFAAEGDTSASPQTRSHVRFNPNHDPKTGEFASDGVNGGGVKEGALSAADGRTVFFHETSREAADKILKSGYDVNLAGERAAIDTDIPVGVPLKDSPELLPMTSQQGAVQLEAHVKPGLRILDIGQKYNEEEEGNIYNYLSDAAKEKYQRAVDASTAFVNSKFDSGTAKQWARTAREIITTDLKAQGYDGVRMYDPAPDEFGFMSSTDKGVNATFIFDPKNITFKEHVVRSRQTQSHVRFNPYHDEKGRFTTGGGAGKGGEPAKTVPLREGFNTKLLGRKKGAPGPAFTAREYHDAAITRMAISKGIEPDITTKMQDVATKVDHGVKNEGLKYRLKGGTYDQQGNFNATPGSSTARTEEKIGEYVAERMRKDKGTPYDLNHASADVKDLVRYTFVSPSEDFGKHVSQVRSELAKRGFEEVKFDNNWIKSKQANPLGYVGINANYRTPRGYVFEVQYHTQRSLDVKEGIDGGVPAHKFYELWRTKGTPKSEKNRLKAESLKRWAEAGPRPQGVETLTPQQPRA